MDCFTPDNADTPLAIAAAIAAAIAEDERKHRLATRLTHGQRFAHALAANGEALL